MADSNNAIGYLELNSKQWDDALASAGKALVAFAAAFASIKTVDFFKDGTEAAIKFGNEAFFAAQKLNGYDPGKLLIVQKALQGAGLSAEEARGKIEEFGAAGRPLEQLFKGGSAGFGEALTSAAKEYGTQAAVLSDSAEKFAFVQKQINDVGTKLQGFFLGLADKIAQPLSDLLSELDKIDLVSMGEQFGKYVTEAIDTINGLYKNGDLFESVGLGLKVGFETAVDFLMQPSLWAGVVKVAVGALALIGNFLTSLFLNVGKLLVASIETAMAVFRKDNFGWIDSIQKFQDKYDPAIIARNKIFGKPKESDASTDINVNLANLEKNNLIQGQASAADEINKKAIDEVITGAEKIMTAAKGTNLSGEDSKKFQAIISKALASGQSTTGTTGKVPTLFSEKADPVGVISDSLAKVGGGGRYVRTGLSIAEKAQMDAARYAKQSYDIQAKYLPKIAVTGGTTGGRFSVTGG